jgi:hypothetical protein
MRRDTIPTNVGRLIAAVSMTLISDSATTLATEKNERK